MNAYPLIPTFTIFPELSWFSGRKHAKRSGFTKMWLVKYRATFMVQYTSIPLIDSTAIVQWDKTSIQHFSIDKIHDHSPSKCMSK